MEPRRIPNTHCDLCTNAIYRRPSTIKRNKGKFCSRACRNKVHKSFGERGENPKLKGENNPAWKGGVTFFKKKGNYKGVVYLRAPEWAKPMARKDGYIMEHRLVVAQLAGRLLCKSEVVHHLDHNPSNNNPKNLELWPTNGSHKKAEFGKIVIGVANLWRNTA